MRHYLPFLPKVPTVAVVRLNGVIAPSARPGSALNDAGIAPLLERAFKKGKPAAVALAVNSPGGSPVQSSLIGQRIRRLSEETQVPVYAFVEDVAASGGYWIAAAADEIWVDPTSIVGSIGVISAGFGLHEFIGRYDIKRRVYTAGESKSFLDPFQPENADDVARLRAIQDDMHSVFIRHIQDRRGPKLSEDDALFTGEFWVGARAVELGLADGVGQLDAWIKARFGDKVRFQRYGQRRSLLSRIGAEAMGGLTQTLEERALYARFGL